MVTLIVSRSDWWPKSVFLQTKATHSEVPDEFIFIVFCLFVLLLNSMSKLIWLQCKQTITCTSCFCVLVSSLFSSEIILKQLFVLGVVNNEAKLRDSPSIRAQATQTGISSMVKKNLCNFKVSWLHGIEQSCSTVNSTVINLEQKHKPCYMYVVVNIVILYHD